MHKPPALMSAFLAATLVIAGVNVAGMAVASEKWTATKLDASAYPADIVENTLEPAPGGLPDGRVATASSGDIRKAWYQSPTTRYAHAVLGDNVEAGELKVEDARGRSASLRLPENEVFEDTTPRIADLDNDGLNEVVTIRSSVSKGASVTIYGMANGVLMQKATTGFIGTANRWLNIAAIAPMAGSGGQEIAFVRTPHIGGDLFIAAYAKGSSYRLPPCRVSRTMSSGQANCAFLRWPTSTATASRNSPCPRRTARHCALSALWGVN